MTPEQEERVRRALRAAAQADDPGPMPPEVADRLDRVLAELAGPTEHHGSDVDELAVRRRRGPQALVAAAAVAIIALGGAAVATHGFGTLGGGEHGTTSAERAPGSEPANAPSQASSVGGQRSLRSGAAAGVPGLHKSTLGSDVRRLLLTRHPLGSMRVPGATSAVPVDCARPFTGAGSSLFFVRLDGRPATLVVGPARNGVRQARVYSCQGVGSPLASVPVPTR